MYLSGGIPLLVVVCCIGHCACDEDQLSPCKRIINGWPSFQPVSWPWLLSIRRMDEHMCGASLISNEWAVTAAHCLYDEYKNMVHPGELVVVAGAKTTIGQDGMPCSVIHFFIHPHYNPFIFPGPYDIALIRLSRGLQIAPVRLPVSGAPINDAECWIAGWGYSTAPVKADPLVLLEAPFPLVEPFQCNSINPSLQLCAGGVGTSPCQGDSGGPLFCNDNGKWVLQGITSFGNEQCVPSKPCVFTRVNAFIGWIALTIKGATSGQRSSAGAIAWPTVGEFPRRISLTTSVQVRGPTTRRVTGKPGRSASSEKIHGIAPGAESKLKPSDSGS